MRIITKNGVKTTSEALPIAEKCVKFNGKKGFMLEKARDLKYASGVLFVDNTQPVFSKRTEFLIGNLTSEKVSEIIRDFGKQGYYDFSQLKYQKIQCESEKVLDGGKSLPYTNEDIDMVIPFGLMGMSNCGFNNGFNNCFGNSNCMESVVNSEYEDEDDSFGEESEFGDGAGDDE